MKTRVVAIGAILMAGLATIMSAKCAYAYKHKGSFLKTGEFLGIGDYLVSDNKSYFAIMQADGNLAVYKGTDPDHPDRNAPNNGFVWGSVQAGQYPASQGQYFAIMQADGNLAVYKGTDPDHPDRNAPNNGFVWGSIQSNRRIEARNVPPPPQLEAHNRERQNYPGVGPLQWSPELARWAQEWAEGRAKEGNINHRSPQNQTTNPFKTGEYLGENIYSSSATGADAVQWWIDEKQWYHYNDDRDGTGSNSQPPGCIIVRDSPACRERQGYCYCGHFTQVIWKNTQYVGCGKATAANGWVYFVCNYYPSGNITGQKPY
jgi:pathogenesis-related protein 1